MRIAREWGVALHERSVGKLLHRLRFARVSTRPRHPKADAAAQASFGWHQDEARVGQQGGLTYVWADTGSRPAALRDQRRQPAYLLFGAVCADRGVGAINGYRSFPDCGRLILQP